MDIYEFMDIALEKPTESRLIALWHAIGALDSLSEDKKAKDKIYKRAIKSAREEENAD